MDEVRAAVHLTPWRRRQRRRRPPTSPSRRSLRGPFDLLLHLCRTSEIDLAASRCAHHRPVSAHLEAMEFRDLEAAGAYLVMAATLIYLKSRLLVPPDETQEEQLDEDGLTSALELEARLREYARSDAGGGSPRREAAQGLIWAVPAARWPRPRRCARDLSVHLLERTLRR